MADRKTELAELRKLVDRMKVGMLTTLDGDKLRSRPLHTREFDADGNLWFFVSASSPKVAELDFDHGEVNLSYADPSKYDFVSISGRAMLVRDRVKMESLWTKMIEVWFPQGIKDPDLALLQVKVESAEYWESPGSAVVRLLAVTKALLTGDASSLGTDRKLQIN